MQRFVITAALVLLAGPLVGQRPMPQRQVNGVRADILRELDEAEKKMVALADATPEDKFRWRPAGGVRSIGETYLHTAASNYLLVSLIGVPTPEGIDLRNFEKRSSDKADVIRRLRKSFEHARTTIIEVPESRLDEKATFYGQERTVRGILLILPVHASEHLGQSIAYARMNGIVPPWSASGN